MKMVKTFRTVSAHHKFEAYVARIRMVSVKIIAHVVKILVHPNDIRV